MKLHVENTLGIVSAEIELIPGQILEVVGPNASGKTSLATCAQAVLARESNPLGLSAADAKRCYPHDGSEDAVVFLEWEHGAEYNAWRPFRGTIQGPTQLSNPEAVGLIDFTAKRGAKERAAVFQNALLPPPEQVMEAVKERLATYLDPKDLAGAMEMLGERGWEATESIYADRAKEAKQSWRAITARNYGVRVAADWRPDGWLADFDHLTVQQAEERVTNARDALNALHRVQAVSEAEQEAAERAANALPVCLAEKERLEEQMSQATAERDSIPLLTIGEAINRLQREIQEEGANRAKAQECPHCHEPLSISSGRIVVASSQMVADARLDALEKELRETNVEYDSKAEQRKPLQKKVHGIEDAIRQIGIDIHHAQQATAKSGTVQTEGDRAALAQTEQEVEDAREVVKMVSAEADAARLHITITRYTEIAKALGPEGVRAKLLEYGLRKLNGGLATIAKAAGWPLTEVKDNGSITCGDRPIAMCSESERWRTQSSLQLTLAAITKSRCAVLDRVDLLDDANRLGLTKAVERVVGKTGMSVLLCGTGAVGDRYAPWQQVGLQSGEVVAA